MISAGSSMIGAMKIVSVLTKSKKVFKGSAIMTADTIPTSSATISGTRRDSVEEPREPTFTPRYHHAFRVHASELHLLDCIVAQVLLPATVLHTRDLQSMV